MKTNILVAVFLFLLLGCTPPKGEPGPQGPPGPVGDVVQKPTGLPAYQIVAAGIVRGNGTSHKPVFNDLKMKAANVPGEVLLSFKGYKVPDGTFQYVVKAMGLSRTPVDINVVFMDFAATGIVLGVMQNGAPSRDVTGLELVVEVSQFFSP
jgi:hypothetical protein